MKKYAGIILLAGLAFVSCDSGTSNSEVSELQGDWQLQSFALNEGSNVPVPNPEAYTARFDADGSVNVRADCNRCSGTYETEGNTRRLMVGRKIQGEVTPVPGKGGKDIVVTNTEYWMGPDITVAKAGKGKVRGFGRVWDFDGKSAEICQIDWHGPD